MLQHGSTAQPPAATRAARFGVCYNHSPVLTPAACTGTHTQQQNRTRLSLKHQQRFSFPAKRLRHCHAAAAVEAAAVEGSDLATLPHSS
jgi:hypothetical protein